VNEFIIYHQDLVRIYTYIFWRKNSRNRRCDRHKNRHIQRS